MTARSTTCHGVCTQHSQLGGHSQLLKGRVSITSCTANATPGNIPPTAGAGAFATKRAVVDEDGRGLLLTRSMIRTPIIVHAEDTKRVVPFSETIEFEFERERKRKRRGWRDIGRFLEGFYILSLCNFTRKAAFEGFYGDQWDASACAF